MNTYPFSGEIKMTKVIKDGQEVIEWEPVEHISMTDGVDITPGKTWTQEHWTEYEQGIVATEREKVAKWMMRQGYATGHGDNIENLLTELEWQIEDRIRNIIRARGEE